VEIIKILQMILKQCHDVIRYLLNPGYAQFNFMLFFLSISIVSIASKWVGLHASFDRRVLGGPASWIGALLIALIIWKFFSQYIRQSARAKAMLRAKELPCLNCGYPLMTDEKLICSECGKHFERSKTIEIWRNRYLIDPFPFEVVDDQ